MSGRGRKESRASPRKGGRIGGSQQRKALRRCEEGLGNASSPRCWLDAAMMGTINRTQREALPEAI